jgi:hypothetical protein
MENGMRTLRLTMYFTEGRSVPAKYEVLGLPVNQSASIANMSADRWQIIRTLSGVLGAWQGDYESAEAALVALTSQVDDQPEPSPAL